MSLPRIIIVPGCVLNGRNQTFSGAASDHNCSGAAEARSGGLNADDTRAEKENGPKGPKVGWPKKAQENDARNDLIEARLFMVLAQRSNAKNLTTSRHNNLCEGP